MDGNEPRLSREQILEGLAALNERLAQREITGEIAIYGGAAMILAFDARESTRDVDALFRPKEEMRKEIASVGADQEWGETWLNDGVKGWLSNTEALTTERMPQWSHLRVVRPTAEYLLAMKCMAARTAGYDTGGDANDVAFLLKKLGIDDAQEALKIVERFYGGQPIHVKTKYFVEEQCERLRSQSGERSSDNEADIDVS